MQEQGLNNYSPPLLSHTMYKEKNVHSLFTIFFYTILQYWMEYYNQNKKDWLIFLEEKYRKLQNWKYGTFSFYVLFPSIPASIIKLKLHFGINAFTKTLKYLPENLNYYKLNCLSFLQIIHLDLVISSVWSWLICFIIYPNIYCLKLLSCSNCL